jgi:heme/copper-type cytochrome/quinol oxidase subunit 4
MENKDDKKINIDLGCFGCLLQVVGIIGLFWILTHISLIINFIQT